MGKKIDEARYQKLMDAIELTHKENTKIAQALMRLAKNGDKNHDYDIEHSCDEIQIEWNNAFWDIRSKGW
jgi:hypothetical protein